MSATPIPCLLQSYGEVATRLEKLTAKPTPLPSQPRRCRMRHRTRLARVRQYHCPSPQHPAWMRRPEIHTPDGGYGIRASLAPVAPQMTGVRFCGRDQLLISADQVFSINLTTESGTGM